MNRLLYFALLSLTALAAASGCSKTISDPVFDEGEFYIYSTTWVAENSIPAGSTFSVNDLYVSPADGSVTCCWTLDGEVISNRRTVSCTFNAEGTHELVFTATKDGVSKTRTTSIIVTQSNQ